MGANVWVKLVKSLFYSFMKIIWGFVRAGAFAMVASVYNLYEGERAVQLLAFCLLPNI